MPINLTKRPAIDIENIDFDTVFEVLPNGVVVECPNEYAPSVCDDYVDYGWTLVNGYSGQYGYSGPIMHESETFTGAMLRDTLNDPGIYALVVAYAFKEGCAACGETIDYCQGHGEMGDPTGWRIINNHNNGDHSDCHYDADCQGSDISGWALAEKITNE